MKFLKVFLLITKKLFSINSEKKIILNTFFFFFLKKIYKLFKILK